MEMDEQDIRWGLEFIVGKWSVEAVVSFFSSNLEPMPASEFKSQDGKDFSQITFEFFEDHTMKISNGDVEESGTWQQKSRGTYSYDCGGKTFGMEGDALKGIQKLENMEGKLVMSIFMFAVRMKKIEEGKITKKPDIGDLVPTEDDLKKKEIVGRWKVYKAMAMVNDDFGMFTWDEVMADIEKKKKEGEEFSPAELSMKKLAFSIVMEFTDDHKVIAYTPLPDDVPQKEIDEAIASGEIKVVDGMMIDQDHDSDWKYVNGDYYYDSKEHIELYGEVQSPWVKITPDSEGHMQIATCIYMRA